MWHNTTPQKKTNTTTAIYFDDICYGLSKKILLLLSVSKSEHWILMTCSGSTVEGIIGMRRIPGPFLIWHSFRVCQLRPRGPLLRARRKPDLNPYQFPFILAGMHSVSMNDPVLIVISQEDLCTLFWLIGAIGTYSNTPTTPTPVLLATCQGGKRRPTSSLFSLSACSLCKIIVVILVQCDTDSARIDNLWSLLIIYEASLIS